MIKIKRARSNIYERIQTHVSITKDMFCYCSCMNLMNLYTVKCMTYVQGYKHEQMLIVIIYH